MNPKYKPFVLLAATFALMVPYMGFMMHIAFRFPHGHWPDWVGNTMLAWFATNFLLLFLLTRRIYKKPTGDTEKPRRTPMKWLVRFSCLVVFWCGLFVYGLYQTILGKYPMKRALPAGAFLLFFIVLFGWVIYREFRKKA